MTSVSLAWTTTVLVSRSWTLQISPVQYHPCIMQLMYIGGYHLICKRVRHVSCYWLVGFMFLPGRTQKLLNFDFDTRKYFVFLYCFSDLCLSIIPALSFSFLAWPYLLPGMLLFPCGDRSQDSMLISNNSAWRNGFFWIKFSVNH